MAFRSSALTHSNNVAASPFVVTAPAGVTSGDVMIMVVTSDSGGATFSSSGWTLVSNLGQVSPDGQATMTFTKVAGSEPGTYNLTTDALTRPHIVIIGCWSGRNTIGSLIKADTINTSNNTSPATINSTGVTALANDDLVWIATIDTPNLASFSFTPPTGFTEIQDDSQDFTAGTMAYQDNVSAGATGTLNGTVTGASTGWASTVIAIPVATIALTITGLNTITGLATLT